MVCQGILAPVSRLTDLEETWLWYEEPGIRTLEKTHARRRPARMHAQNLTAQAIEFAGQL
jgi:hypothetical protein